MTFYGSMVLRKHVGRRKAGKYLKSNIRKRQGKDGNELRNFYYEGMIRKVYKKERSGMKGQYKDLEKLSVQKSWTAVLKETAEF